MIETITTALMGWGISKVADTIWQGASDRVQNTLKKTDIERAIKSGLKATDEWKKHQTPQNRLFYSVKPDGINGVSQFLEKVFSHGSVQQQLQRALNNEGQPQFNYLVAAFQQVAEQEKIKLNQKRLTPWIEEFIEAYFQATTTYLTFQVTKQDYFKQLANFFDDIKFAGIDVPGEEIEKSERLTKIFVMPDVREEVDSWNLKTDFVPGKGERSLLENPSERKLLASQLLHQTHSKKFVLLGAPGSGKTTLLSYFAVMLARDLSTANLDDKTPNILGLDPTIDR